MFEDKEAKYAIYIAERLEREMGDQLDTWYHTFLLLVDETTEPVTVLQQLHYNDDIHGNLLPNVRMGLSDPDKFKDVLVYPLVGGRAKEILEGWNAALSFAFYLKHSNIPFGDNYKYGEMHVNCRAAIIATLKSIGIDTDESSYAQKAGVYCQDIPVSKIFEFSATGNAVWEDLKRKNEEHRLTLDADWVPNERFIGPLNHPLKLMF